MFAFCRKFIVHIRRVGQRLLQYLLMAGNRLQALDDAGQCLANFRGYGSPIVPRPPRQNAVVNSRIIVPDDFT